MLIDRVDCDQRDIKEYFEVDKFGQTSWKVDDKNDDSNKVNHELPAKVLFHDLCPILYQISQFLKLSVRSHKNHIDYNDKNTQPVDDQPAYALNCDKFTVV